MVSGIVHGMPDVEYHARPELSSSGARLLLPMYKGSPKKFQYAQTHRKTSRAYDVGHAVHSKVLGVGLGIVVHPEEHLTPSGNVSTSKATVAWEAEKREAGFTVVSPEEAQRVKAMSEAILGHETARLYLEVAVHREVSIFAEVDGVPCRARIDALSGETRNGVYAVDIKTTEDATENGVTHSVKKYGYDVQDAFYDDVHEASEGHGIDQFWFVFVEKSAPHEVSVFTLTAEWIAMGKAKAAKARQLFKQATETGKWPGYSSEPRTVAPPTWAVIEHEMEYESGEIQF